MGAGVGVSMVFLFAPWCGGLGNRFSSFHPAVLYCPRRQRLHCGGRIGDAPSAWGRRTNEQTGTEYPYETKAKTRATKYIPDGARVHKKRLGAARHPQKKTKILTNARTHLTDPLAPAPTQLPPSRVPPPPPPRLLPLSRRPQTASAAHGRAKRAPPAPPPSSPAGRAPPRGSPG